MLTDVLPQLAMSGAQAVRRVLERRGGEVLPGSDLQGLLRQSRLSLEFVIDMRDRYSQVFREAGVEATGFRKTCTELGETVDLFLASIHDLRAQVQRQPDEAERAAQLGDLVQQEAQAQEARRSVAEWLEMLSRPFPPIDQERLRRGTAEAAAGQAEDVESILARLKAGGDV